MVSILAIGTQRVNIVKFICLLYNIYTYKNDKFLYFFFREELEKCRNHLKMLQDEFERVKKEMKEAENNNQKYDYLFNKLFFF